MKKSIWASAFLLVVVVLVFLNYRHKKSNSKPATAKESQSVLVTRGAPAGPATNAIIGAGGGEMKSSDGRLAISIPVGALFADTPVSIQPLTDTEGIAVGPVYQLSPEGSNFAQPVMLTWQLTEADLAGHKITDVAIGTREGDAGWSRQRGATHDPTTRTVRVAATHFSSWAGIWDSFLPPLSISPENSEVTVTSSLPLEVSVDQEQLKASFPTRFPGNQPPTDPNSDNELLAPPSRDEFPDSDLLAVPTRKGSTAPCTNWRVNGRLGGNSTWGTVQAGEENRATFVAPAKVPSRNPVAVSCEAFYKRSKVIASANVTIKDKASGWHGTLEYTYSESHTTSRPNGAGGTVTNFATESRKVTGNFKLSTDYMGWGSLDGTGTGNAEVIKTDGMRNPICSTDGGTTTTGDVKVAVGGTANAGEGTLTVSANGDNLESETHLDDTCTKQHPHQGNSWKGYFGVSCQISGIDFVKGGTYEANVPADNGHGKCKVTISPN